MQAGVKEEREARMRALACDVVDECRVQLMLKFRFLDMALWRMPLSPVAAQMRYPLATDGSTVHFGAERVLARFSDSFEEAVRDYLHLVLHCIFCHPFDARHPNANAWDLACDVVAERAAMDMCAGRFESELDAERRRVLDELALLEGDEASPAKLYRLFDAALKAPAGHAHRNLGPSKLADMRALFERDGHEAWAQRASDEGGESKPGDPENDVSDKPDEDAGEAPDEAELDEAPRPDADRQPSWAQGDGAGDEDEDVQAPPEEGRAVADAQADETGDADTPDAGAPDPGDEDGQGAGAPEAAAPEEERDPDPAEAPEHERERAEQEWRDIAKQVEMDLHTFSQEWGKEAGSLVASLKATTRRRYDYDAFLRRFAMPREEMKLNDDEFDYVYYTYGMGLYGNMPLIEPLEYQDTKRVRQFVIAIDTSASCAGELVARFVSHTFDILMSSQTLAAEIDVRIVQCDSKVQADTRIRDRNELRAYMDAFRVRGFGGTDFRPVFSYVNDLRCAGELADLKGLVYFTDGFGTFPAKPPGYEAAFVFMDDGEAQIPAVPPWAMKIVVDEEDLDAFSA